MKLGVHVPIAGGFDKALAWAQQIGCTTMQLFSRSPRGGSSTALPAAAIAEFDALRRRAGIDPLAVHGPYIINLASPEPAMWKRSAALYRDEYARTLQLGAQYLVTHVGSHKGHGVDEGIARVAEALNRALEGQAGGAMILLENTAGAGQGIGDQFEQLAAIRAGVDDRARVGICLDTAHLFAAGHPIHTQEGLRSTLEAFDRAVGLERLKLIHLNDSKAPFGARVDRHWHIGRGHIGLEAFGRIVNHPALAEVPMILETPKSSPREDARNLATVRKLVKSQARQPVASGRST